MKVAFILRGGISKVQSRLSFPSSINSADVPFVNFLACSKSINQHIFDANPGVDFDVYLQSWNPELKEALIEIYNPRSHHFSFNSQYENEIRIRCKESLRNEPIKISNFRERIRSLTPGEYTRSNDYSGISQALAIHLGIQLVEKSVEQYDFVILYRPDLLLVKDICLNNYNSNVISVNNYDNCLGDFHWIFKPDYLLSFSRLWESTKIGNYHETHFWIKRYFDFFLKIPYEMDRIIAGKDQEVLRQIKATHISFEEARRFGVTRKEFDSYTITS